MLLFTQFEWCGLNEKHVIVLQGALMHLKSNCVDGKISLIDVQSISYTCLVHTLGSAAAGAYPSCQEERIWEHTPCEETVPITAPPCSRLRKSSRILSLFVPLLGNIVNHNYIFKSDTDVPVHKILEHA